MNSNTMKGATLRPDGIGKSPHPAWMGIPAALMALVARRPGTPLRVLAVVAITAALRSRGVRLRPDTRRAVIEALELGALLNDRFDGEAVDPAALREQVAWFARSPHRELVRCYAKRLRRHERFRPNHGEPIAVVKPYRENVNRTSLALLWALASGTELAAAELEIRQAGDLRLLFNLVMLTQVMDDVLDAAHDRNLNLPSFATASGATAASLHAVASLYAAAPPLRLDGNFCLRLALAITAACTRGMIAIRSVGEASPQAQDDYCRSPLFLASREGNNKSSLELSEWWPATSGGGEQGECMGGARREDRARMAHLMLPSCSRGPGGAAPPRQPARPAHQSCMPSLSTTGVRPRFSSVAPSSSEATATRRRLPSSVTR
jgi:hypothetical protein